jgi:type I restriction enzyme, S subunit
MKAGKRYEAAEQRCGRSQHEPAASNCRPASADFLRECSAMSAVPAGYKQTAAGVIPEEWAVSSFGDVFSITAGGDVDPKRSQSFHDEIHCYRIYSSALTNCGHYGYCSYADHPAGSLTITARGMVGAANFRDHPYTAIGRVLVLQPKSEIAGIYFAEVINSRVKFANESTGVPQLTAPQISKYRLPVPPLPEQRAIAAALSDVDALLAKLDQLIGKKRDLKQAAIQQLLTGQTRLPGFSGAWEVKRLGDVGTFMKGSGIKKDEARSGDIPCVRYGEIYTHHNDYIRAYNSHISPAVAATATPLKQSDLLFAGSGETKEEIGKCVAFVDDVVAYAGGDIVILRPKSASALFLGYYCNTAPINAQKASRGQGDAVVHISATALSEVEITIPSIEEQTAIAAVLSDMDVELAALDARRDKTRALKQGMMQELLTGRIRLV